MWGAKSIPTNPLGFEALTWQERGKVVQEGVAGDIGGEGSGAATSSTTDSDGGRKLRRRNGG